MPPVLRVVRQLTAVLAALAVVGAVLLPAEHVHALDAADGHHADLVHRHFALHQQHHADDHTTVENADDDHDVQWLTTAFTKPGTSKHVHSSEQSCVTGLVLQRPDVTAHGIAGSLFVSVHDPPWSTPSGLRAPPSFRI
jgi:hypothetical protein